MRCASCAAENPADARFCIQCGAEQALPTPIAAVAAAVSGQRGHAAVARAANAPHADMPHEREVEPLHEREASPLARASGVVAASMREPRNAAERRSVARPNPARAQPAYAQGPAHGHLAAFLIVLAFAIAAVAFGAWKMLGGQFRSDNRIPGTDRSVMSSFPPEATPSPRRPIDSPSPVPPASSEAAATPSPPAATSQAPRASDDKAGEAGATAAASATQPIEIRSLPAKPAPRPAHRRAAPEKVQPATQAPPAEGSAPPPVRPAEVAAAPPPQPVVDRWTRMADELSRCTREDFITRVICDQRVRFRYCGNYWGKVPQCPGSPAPERGQ